MSKENKIWKWRQRHNNAVEVMNNTTTYEPLQLIAMGFLGALALLLPFFFHLIPQGKSLMPIFLPISIAGFLLGLKYSLTLSVLVPIFSFSLYGMPPLLFPPIGIILIIELSLLVFFNFFFYQHCKWNLYLSTLLSLIINRILYLVILFIVADFLKIPKMTFTFYSAIKPLPGLILLLFLVPSVVQNLQKNPFFSKTHDTSFL